MNSDPIFFAKSNAESPWAKEERPTREWLLLSEIDSGLNEERKRLQQLLKLVWAAWQRWR
jgi:hypothetical protein